MYGYIYLTTNLVNKKQYIGQHKSSEFDNNYFGSGKLLVQALNKYGTSNFTCEILKECDSQDELNLQEEYFIKKYNAVESNKFYNLCEGGHFRTPKNRCCINRDSKIKRVDKSEVDNYLQEGWKLGGLPQSEESILKRVLKNKGKKRSLDTRIKISSALKGKKVSEHTRELNRITHLGLPNRRKNTYVVTWDHIHYFDIPKQLLDDYINQGYILEGRKTSKSHGENIRKSKSNTICITDGKQFKYIQSDQLEEYIQLGYYKGTPDNFKTNRGKIWVTKDSTTIMIEKSELDSYLNIGYHRGRK